MATFEGTAFLIEGSENGWNEPRHIKDVNDTNVRISMYYDMEENEYKDVDRSTDDYESNASHHMTSIALVDWDEDGDQDLILGAYEGALYLCMNEGTPSEPKFAASNLQVMANGSPITIEGGLATPRVVDWDADGLFDILCGGSKGAVYYYRNQGKKGEPEFAAAETLISKTTGSVESSSDGSDPMEDYLSSMMVPSKDGLPACPGTSFHIETVDYDGDGDLDLLVGAQSYFRQEQKDLSEAEEEELAEINEKMEGLQEKLMKMYEGLEREEMQELMEDEEFQKLSNEMNELYERSEELQPSPEPANLIWLYRNKATSTGASTDRPDLSNASDTLDALASAGAIPEFDTDKFAVKAVFTPATAGPGDEVLLTVYVQVPEGFHVYGSSNSLTPTTMTLDDAGGLSSRNDAVVPPGKLVVDAGKPAFWLEDVFTVHQTLKVPEDFSSATVEGSVHYTMCNEQGCRPPTSEKFSATLKTSK